jgi:uncharacterized protein (DUF433 family)
MNTKAPADPVLRNVEQSRFPLAEQDLRAAAILRRSIADTARKGEGETVPYGKLVEGVKFHLETVNEGRPFEMDPRHLTQLHRHIIGEFLGYLARESFLLGRFFSSALVVNKEEGRPSPSFFEWVRALGALRNGDEEAFWTDQLRRAHRWYTTHADDPIGGIEATAGVCGGEARVKGTRIPVWLLEQARRVGSSQSELLRAYPMLKPDDLANAWAYAQSHREEIDRQIMQNEEA